MCPGTAIWKPRQDAPPPLRAFSERPAPQRISLSARRSGHRAVIRFPPGPLTPWNVTLRSSGSPFAVLRARMPVSTWITMPLTLLLASAALACAGDQQAETLDTAQAAAARPQPVTADSADPRMAAADSARILGSDTASVWVIEVSDFQCPFCRVWHENTFDEFREEFIDSGRIRFAYVNMPLRMHQHAREAAHYAMCAGAQ